jgi:serine/threonine protein kinase
MSEAFSKQVFKSARRLISMLRDLHSYGIIHNDIFKPNISFRESSVSIDSDDIVLIDFEFASFFPSKFGEPIEIKPKHNINPLSLSVWQSKGQRSGPRDDVYRVILLVADLLSRGEYSASVARRVNQNLNRFGNPKKGSRAFLEIIWDVARHVKSDFHLFDLGSVAHIELRENRHQIFDHLHEIEIHVKSYTHPDSIIEYDYLESKFDEIVGLFP